MEDFEEKTRDFSVSIRTCLVAHSETVDTKTVDTSVEDTEL